ncbi:hypothetical protein B0H13DRAFT_1868036 [Mycena leptocephala]|nr:hypothetical protein B0H13DRAFT_1868036 [Mycena leptocephala]
MRVARQRGRHSDRLEPLAEAVECGVNGGAAKAGDVENQDCGDQLQDAVIAVVGLGILRLLSMCKAVHRRRTDTSLTGHKNIEIVWGDKVVGTFREGGLWASFHSGIILTGPPLEIEVEKKKFRPDSNPREIKKSQFIEISANRSPGSENAQNSIFLIHAFGTAICCNVAATQKVESRLEKSTSKEIRLHSTRLAQSRDHVWQNLPVPGAQPASGECFPVTIRFLLGLVKNGLKGHHLSGTGLVELEAYKSCPRDVN